MIEHKKIFALVDCNAFYCSCERLFRPDLAKRPVGVLSNNDGCFVSRTNELKKLGVPMGAPYFQYQELCRKNNVAVFSANFSLYTNLSDRVMTVLSHFAPLLEVYSIDEAFLDLSGMEHLDLVAYGIKIKSTVERFTGIPVTVGIGHSKTLAKVAATIGKKNESKEGVVVLLDERSQDEALQSILVGDIWGVGKANSIKLNMLGIKNAYQFKQYKNEALIQKMLTKVGRQTQDELRGIPCFMLKTEIEKKKEIISSRSFAGPVYDLENLREAIANYASLASEKLRKQDSVCASVEVYIRTSPFNENSPQYFAHETTQLEVQSNDTRKIIKYAFAALSKIYRHGYEYKKAQIRLSGIRNSNDVQPSLFSKGDTEQDQKLMKVMDQINAKEGPFTIKLAACGVEKAPWIMRQTFKSHRYVSGWNELPKVK